MKNREEINQLLHYFQSIEGEEWRSDEEAIVAAYQKDNDHQSLAIKILTVFGGLLGSLAFTGFLLIAGLYDSSAGLIAFGMLCIIGAIWVNKAYDNILIDTVGVSSFIIGFTLIGMGTDRLNLGETSTSILFILIALLSMSIVRNYIISFISVLVIHGSILMIILSNEGYNLVHIYVSVLGMILTSVFMREARIISNHSSLSSLYNPVRSALVFSFLSALFTSGGSLSVESSGYIWISSVTIITALLYLMSFLFKTLAIVNVRHRLAIYVCTVLVLSPTVLAPSIAGALLVIMLSFFVNYKTGLVAGIIALIYFLSSYYYDLNFTLLTKSLLLISSGILFIGLYFLTHKKLSSNENV